ncbi:exported protein of unknown function [Bradyrhizobium sp. ORS 285]|uniref:hypothetical protein n=1 Tax=Bradyrhizobium sp. ORS 285 TaxID=115808 RepID=UPI0002407955|nr:hypothetical protein [Bradyrhizobium sp. ORS 285]CCD89052.1 exported hypothetical protein [Bradyrhizobium sp. ORS 285]SMX58286.1 exported protein of unknown function [Bradyrhizobium sp. ORS 285]
MRGYLLAAAIMSLTLGFSSPARAGCWPSESYPLVCWLDTKGWGCVAHHALTGVKAVYYPQPRYSLYELEATHWWTSGSTTACPPTKTTKFTGTWDRETGLAEETATTTGGTLSRHVTCSHNPWTGQGSSGVPICASAANDPNAGTPASPGLLSPGQKDDLLHVQEPLHTSCELLSPAEIGWHAAKVNSVVQVVVAHHEFQKIEWHLWYAPSDGLGLWQEVAPPKPKFIMMWPATKYSERQIATSTRKFWLNKAGRWKVVAVPKPISPQAQAIPTTVTNECYGVFFNTE